VPARLGDALLERRPLTGRLAEAFGAVRSVEDGVEAKS